MRKLDPIYHNHPRYKSVFFYNPVIKDRDGAILFKACTKAILLDKEDDMKVCSVGYAVRSHKDPDHPRLGRVISFGRGLRAMQKDLDNKYGFKVSPNTGAITSEEFKVIDKIRNKLLNPKKERKELI